MYGIISNLSLPRSLAHNLLCNCHMQQQMCRFNAYFSIFHPCSHVWNGPNKAPLNWKNWLLLTTLFSNLPMGSFIEEMELHVNLLENKDEWLSEVDKLQKSVLWAHSSMAHSRDCLPMSLTAIALSNKLRASGWLMGEPGSPPILSSFMRSEWEVELQVISPSTPSSCLLHPAQFPSKRTSKN